MGRNVKDFEPLQKSPRRDLWRGVWADHVSRELRSGLEFRETGS